MTHHERVPAGSKCNTGLHSWWPRLWPLLLLLAIAAFFAQALPPYLAFDPGRSRIPAPPGFPSHYPLLVAHIFFATIAMVTAGLQLWTGFGRRYPALHRLIGRVYVLGGVLPAGLAGLAVGSVSPFGPTLRVSNVLLALLWLTCTILGFRMARRGHFAEHRRWMLRSFVLTMSIITNRVWSVVLAIVLMPQLATTFGGNEVLFAQAVAGLTGWLGWVLPLIALEWWLIERVGSLGYAQVEHGQTSRHTQSDEGHQGRREPQTQLRSDVGISAKTQSWT